MKRRTDPFGDSLVAEVKQRRALDAEVRSEGSDVAGVALSEGDIVTIHNNYLVVQPVDSLGNDVGDQVNVLKPQFLRHTTLIDGASLASDDAQTVTASKAGSDDETWVVSPPYTASRIGFRPTQSIEVANDAGDGNVTAQLVDTNEDARYWFTEGGS